MFWIVLCLAVIALLVGARALFMQYKAGLSTTGLSDRFSWGLYIQGFLVLGSLAGGVLLIAGFFGLFIEANVLAIPAGALALGCLAGGGIMILSDLGKPFRSLLLMLGKNLDATMTWDFFTFGLCGVMALIAVICGIAGVIPGSVWSVLAIIFAAAFLLVHVLLLLSRQGNPVSQPFLALEIFIRGIWGGSALLTLLMISMGFSKGTASVLLITSIIVALAHFAAKFSKPRPENAPKRRLFTCLTLADFAVVVLTLIGLYARADWLVCIAAILALLILFWEKFILLRGLQEEAVLPAPYSQWQKRQSYRPSSLEWQVGLGALGLAFVVAQIAWLLISL